MRQVDLVIIGGGPAGLSAAKVAAECGVHSIVIERDYKLGGQLVKQTHMFFGSEKQYAKTRGINIAQILIDDCLNYPELITFMIETTVVGLYPDNVVTVVKDDTYEKIKFKDLIIATGASEKFLAFENNDLPGIYGAGAVQTCSYGRVWKHRAYCKLSIVASWSTCFKSIGSCSNNWWIQSPCI